MSWLSTTLVACVSIVALHSCVAHLLSYDNRWRNKETLKTMHLGTHAVSHLEPFDPSSRVMKANPELNPSLIQCRHVKANESTRVFRCVAIVGSVATELLLHVFSKGYSPRPLHGKYTNPIEPRSQHSHLVHSCRYGRLVALLGRDHGKNGGGGGGCWWWWLLLLLLLLLLILPTHGCHYSMASKHLEEFSSVGCPNYMPTTVFGSRHHKEDICCARNHAWPASRSTSTPQICELLWNPSKKVLIFLNHHTVSILLVHRSLRNPTAWMHGMQGWLKAFLKSHGHRTIHHLRPRICRVRSVGAKWRG